MDNSGISRTWVNDSLRSLPRIFRAEIMGGVVVGGAVHFSLPRVLDVMQS